MKLKRRRSLDHEEHVKKKQRYEVDYNLEPFAGLTPEYMEMSEWGGKKAFQAELFWLNGLESWGFQTVDLEDGGYGAEFNH